MDPRPETTIAGATTRLILSRRSIRFGFTDEHVEPATVELILRCGMAAPSSKNSMPWRLHAVTRRETLDAIAAAMRDARNVGSYVPHDPLTGAARPEYRSTVVDSAAVLEEAPLAIVIEHVAPFSRGLDQVANTAPERLRSTLFGLALEMIGVGAAIENMWIAALDQGLQGCFLGDTAIGEDRVQQLLGCDGDILGALVFGHSAAAPVPPMDTPARPDLNRIVYHGPSLPVVAPNQSRERSANE